MSNLPRTSVDVEIVGSPVTDETVAAMEGIATGMKANIRPAESIIERLLIRDGRHECDGGFMHSLGVRLFDVMGFTICEDCIREMAPLMAALDAALKEEG